MLPVTPPNTDVPGGVSVLSDALHRRKVKGEGENGERERERDEERSRRKSGRVGCWV